MDIKEVHIGQKVMTETGRIGTVDAISSDSVYVMFGSSSACLERVHVGDLMPVSDPCASCEMAATITSQCKQIAELQRSVEAWTETAARHCRNESYYRDELTKLQNEALAECHKTPINCAGDDDSRPLEEVAKIYMMPSSSWRSDTISINASIPIVPDKLLMSQEARRIIEYLAAIDRPLYIGGIMEGMKDIMAGMAIMDGIMEARDAGRISLVNGKYEIVRD